MGTDVTVGFYGRGMLDDKLLDAVWTDWYESLGEDDEIEAIVPISSHTFSDELGKILDLCIEEEVPVQIIEVPTDPQHRYSERYRKRARQVLKSEDPGFLMVRTLSNSPNPVLYLLPDPADSTVGIKNQADLERVARMAVEAEIPIFDLTHGLLPLELTEAPDADNNVGTDHDMEEEMAPEAEEEEFEVFDEDELEEKTDVELRAIAKELEINIRGEKLSSRPKIIARILEVQEELIGDEDEEDDEDEADDEAVDEDEDEEGEDDEDDEEDLDVDAMIKSLKSLDKHLAAVAKIRDEVIAQLELVGDDEDDGEPEPAPAPKRGRPAKAAPAPAAKKAPAKRAAPAAKATAPARGRGARTRRSA